MQIKNDRLRNLELRPSDYEFEQSTMFDVDDYELEEGEISQAEARLRSETARKALGESDELPAWYEEYIKLLQGGRPWRMAAYIAWASMPKNKRIPKTQKELATEILGLTSDRQIIKWRTKDPSLMEMVTNLQAAKLLEHRANVFDALITSAEDPDYKSHNDRKLFLELTGDYVPSSKIDAIMSRSAGAGYENDSTVSLENLVDG